MVMVLLLLVALVALVAADQALLLAVLQLQAKVMLAVQHWSILAAAAVVLALLVEMEMALLVVMEGLDFLPQYQEQQLTTLAAVVAAAAAHQAAMAAVALHLLLEPLTQAAVVALGMVLALLATADRA